METKENKTSDKQGTERIFDYLRSKHTAVLSTLSDGMPFGSTISYRLGRGHTIQFITREGSRKYQNLSKNGQVSIVVYEDSREQISAQIEGNVIKKTNPSQRDLLAFMDVYWGKAPYFPNYLRLRGGNLRLVTIAIEKINWYYFETGALMPDIKTFQFAHA